MSASDYLENKIMQSVFGVTTWVAVPGRFLALFTGAPTDVAASGTEVSTSGTAYARQTIAFTISGTAPTQAANTSQIDFPTATGSGFGTVTHFAVFDAVSGGNMLSWGALTASKTIAVGDVLRIPAASIVITLD